MDWHEMEDYAQVFANDCEAIEGMVQLSFCQWGGLGQN